ncbi:hypothetical protein ACFLTD_00430, partial [Elusimicrobiota bacterium]
KNTRNQNMIFIKKLRLDVPGPGHLKKGLLSLNRLENSISKKMTGINNRKRIRELSVFTYDTRNHR